MVIAITGASGYIGRFVAAELHRHSVHIRALARPTTNRAGFAGDIDWIEGDLSNQAAIRQLVNSADAVIHLAYKHIPGRYRGGEGEDLEGWLHANMHGSLQLLLAARNAGVKKFVFLSSRAVFSRTEPNRQLDETHPTSPNTHYGAYKVALEALLASFAAVEGMQTISLRATGVYGLTYPIERTKWWELVGNVLAGVPVTSQRGGTEIHGADVARTVWAALMHPNPPPIIHLSDLYLTTHNLVEMMARLAGVSAELPLPLIEPPRNLLVCEAIQTLDIRFGGYPLLEQTLCELIAHHRNDLILPSTL